MCWAAGVLDGVSSHSHGDGPTGSGRKASLVGEGQVRPYSAICTPQGALEAGASDPGREPVTPTNKALCAASTRLRAVVLGRKRDRDEADADDVEMGAADAPAAPAAKRLGLPPPPTGLWSSICLADLSS